MNNKLFEIRVNSTESNKDDGFEILLTSGLSILCLEDEKYIVPEKGIELLKKGDVKFDLISINGERCLKN